MRRLVALERVPMFADVPVLALSALAEQARDFAVKAGEPVRAAPDAIVFAPEHGDDAAIAGAPARVSSAPGLAARLAGAAAGTELRAAADGIAVEVRLARLFAAMEDDFSLFLAVSGAIAREALEGAAARGSVGVRGAVEAPLASLGNDAIARVLHLQTILPFASQRIGSLFQLARHAAEIRAADGVELWRKGDASDLAVFPVHGAIRAHVDGAGALVIEPGSGLSIAAALARGARKFTAVAAGYFVGFTLPVERFLDVLEDEPELARAVLETLARASLDASSEGRR